MSQYLHSPKEISFSDFMRIVRKYIDVMKQGSTLELCQFQKEYPVEFMEKIHELVHEFLLSTGFNEKLIEDLHEVKQDKCYSLTKNNYNEKNILH